MTCSHSANASSLAEGATVAANGGQTGHHLHRWVLLLNTPQIYAALKEASGLGKITVVGFDGDPATLGSVKDGSIAGTVVQQPYLWAYQGMKLMAAYLKGDKSGIPPNKQLIIPTRIITKATVDTYATEEKSMGG